MSTFHCKMQKLTFCIALCPISILTYLVCFSKTWSKRNGNKMKFCFTNDPLASHIDLRLLRSHARAHTPFSKCVTSETYVSAKR